MSGGHELLSSLDLKYSSAGHYSTNNTHFDSIFYAEFGTQYRFHPIPEFYIGPAVILNTGYTETVVYSSGLTLNINIPTFVTGVFELGYAPTRNFTIYGNISINGYRADGSAVQGSSQLNLTADFSSIYSTVGAQWML